ncbi:zinc-ribbon domain-containing protein [Plantactinospora sp. S1510]|uniref:Zinc-ribbon domain-containing protein n=1 Tax=Plantactinospora alkalitolerans TaxID=2789879 RepID=A0ABS0GSP5_9ACTN|nr:zinc-ribbon domain-containing protein [Plantactinospora alkalitolerans]MBF9129215.1 zinc-ribbon domain-containing protein [Plantactinospora alkalitolerans]
MFLIFGLRTRSERLGLVPMACRVCGQSGSMLLVREITRFSLFFVPLFRVRTKHVLYCTNPLCGTRTGIGADEARALVPG